MIEIQPAVSFGETTAVSRSKKKKLRTCRCANTIVPFLFLLFEITSPTNGFFLSKQGSRHQTNRQRHRRALWRTSVKLGNPSAEMNSNNEQDSSLLLPLMKLASTHCASQALYTAVQLKLLDILDEKQAPCSIDELCEAVTAASATSSQDNGTNRSCNRDALLRTMRLLTTIGIVCEENDPPTGDDTPEWLFSFSLTTLGKSLRTNSASNAEPSMASCILHWMEKPLWDSWLGLPGYILEGESSTLPFERANNGVSSDAWYNREEHPESLRHANNFVRLIHDQEIEAVAERFDWSFCRGKRLVDVGGHNGKLAAAIAQREPTIDCYCFDLPEVIEGVPIAPEGVTMVPGNVFDSATIPPCEVILMKHFCDRCMWDEPQTVELLRCCRSALQKNGSSQSDDAEKGRIVIADAVLPDCGGVNEKNELALYLDALYMLVGRERQRTRREWEQLANKAGLDLVLIESTTVPSCSLIVLETR